MYVVCKSRLLFVSLCVSLLKFYAHSRPTKIVNQSCRQQQNYFLLYIVGGRGQQQLSLAAAAATTRKNEQRTNELSVAVISLGPQQTQQARFEERVNRSEKTTKIYSNNLITHTQMFVYKLST